MREIKFRAWHESEKKMFYPDNKFHLITGNKVLKLDPQIELYRYYIMPIEIEVMQYTGLKDSNGVEIYENDIIDVAGSVEGSGKWKVVFEEGAFCVETPRYICLLFPDIFESAIDYRVIGNIHEHPELVKI